MDKSLEPCHGPAIQVPRVFEIESIQMHLNIVLIARNRKQTLTLLTLKRENFLDEHRTGKRV